MRALVAVDLQHEPERVVDLAAAWVARLGGTADLLFADAFRDLAKWGMRPYVHQVLAAEVKRIAESDRAAVDALIARIPAAHRGVAEVVDGHADQEIPARAEGYDLIVLGTHGRKGLAHLLLGSVAERVVRNSTKPVLIVRTPPPAGPMRGLLALDVASGAAGTLALALPWLEDLGAVVDLAYVEDVVVPAALTTDAAVSAAVYQALTNQRKEHGLALDALLQTVPAPMRGAAHLGDGDAARRLATLGADFDLAVVVTHGRTGLDRWWLGSVAENLVRRATQSVLVLRLPEAP